MNQAEKLSKEVAWDHINIFLDYYDIDLDDIDDKEQKRAVELSIKKLIKPIQEGLLVIKEKDGSIQVIQRMKKTDSVLTYAEISGKHKVMMGKDSDDNGFKRMYTLVASLTSMDYEKIENLKGIDSRIVEGLASLFLAS